MSIITQLLDSKNKTETIKNMWEVLDFQAIPALIYLSLAGEQEDRDSACSVLYKISYTSTEAQAPTSAQIVTYPPGEQSKDSSQKRIIVKVPKTMAVTSKSISFSFHIFAMQCHQFSQDVLNDTLSLLPKYFEIADFVLSPRILLDMLTILPLFFSGDKKDEAYRVLNLVKNYAEERSIAEVIVSANSLLVLFPAQ